MNKTIKVTGEFLGLSEVKGRLLLPKEFAPFLRISERTAQSWMHDGTFPIRWYNLGPKQRMVDSNDLNNYMAKIRAEAGSAVLPPKAVKQIQKTEEVVA
jgi:hypothetical protein